MEISDKNLDEFRSWLLERGRSSGTANLYITNIRSCAADQKQPLTHRLVAGSLSPNSRRTNLAALRAWALFSDDAKMTKRLSDIRLPPARRVRVKLPLEVLEWKKVVAHLKTCKMQNEALRQVLLLIAIRGFRSGDVLRMLRTDMESALASGKLIYEGKGRKQIEFSAIPIRPQLEALVEFKGWNRVRDLISTSENPEIARKKVWRAARRTAHKVGVFKMNPHRYRHTFATLYLKRLSGDPQAMIKLQQYMGWESLHTAARYVGSVSQDELDVIGAGLMNGLLE